MSQNKAFIFMGKSGSGKGTQSALLEKYLKQTDPHRKVLYLETGQRFREIMQGDNVTARKIKHMLDEGELLPAFLPIWVWSGLLVDHYSGDEHVIFDGMARRLYEANVLDSALGFYFKSKPEVINIDVSDDWATERLLERGRYDDNEQDIRARLGWYDQQVSEVLDFFSADPEHFHYHNINGEQSIEQVHADIIASVFDTEEYNNEYIHQAGN